MHLQILFQDRELAENSPPSIDHDPFKVAAARRHVKNAASTINC